MNDVIDQFVSNFDAGEFVKVILPMGLVCFALGLVFRLLLGKKSSLNRAITSSIAIIVSYVTVLISHSFEARLDNVVNALPLITLEGTTVTVGTFAGLDIPGICRLLFPVVILSFVTNLIEYMIPKGKNIFLWLLTRVLVVILSVSGYILAMTLLNFLVPAQWLQWLPMLLLAVLGLSFLLGVLKLLLGLVLSAINPVIAACYAFFFGHSVGKSMSRSLLTTLVLSGLVLLLNHLGYTQLDLAGIDPGVFAPGGIIMLIVWYIICRIF